MTKNKLFLGAALVALMIGASPAAAQYYTEYKPNDKPLVEVDMGVLDGTAEPQRAPGYVPPVAREPLPVAVEEPAPEPEAVPAKEPETVAAPEPARVLKPVGKPPAPVVEEVVDEAEAAPAPAPAPRAARSYPDKPYRPYLTTPAAKKPAPAPQVVKQAPPPAPAPVRSYPPAPTPKVVESAPPSYAPALQPVRSMPPKAEPKAEPKKEVVWDEPVPVPALAPTPEQKAPEPKVVEQAAPAPAPQPELPKPAHKPAVAKQSPSIVDDPSYKPDYTGYYKSGAPVPTAVANLEPKRPGHKPEHKPEPKSEAPKTPEPEVAAVEPVPPAPLPKPASEPKLDPLPQIATEKSIEQDLPPAAKIEPLPETRVAETKVAMAEPVVPPTPAPKPASSKIVSMPEPVSTPAPSYQAARTPSKIISYPDSTVVARPSQAPAYQPAPVMTPEPEAKPLAAPEEKIVSMPQPTPKPQPAPAPVVEAAAPAAEPLPEVIPAKRDPAPPAALAAAMEKTESIIPPPRPEAGKTDISQLAAQIDGATAEMAAPQPVEEQPKFPVVPSAADLTLDFPGNSSDLTAAAQRKLDAVIRQMEDLADGGRLQVRGFATGEEGSKSSARRIALSRALSVRSYLMDKGVKAKRVDVRALGAETDRNPLDRVDLIFQK